MDQKPVGVDSSSVEKRPPYSFTSMIAMAILSSADGMLHIHDIRSFVVNRFPFYRKDREHTYKNVVNCLGRNGQFVRVAAPPKHRLPIKCAYWALHPEALDVSDDGAVSLRPWVTYKMRQPDKDLLESAVAALSIIKRIREIDDNMASAPSSSGWDGEDYDFIEVVDEEDVDWTDAEETPEKTRPPAETNSVLLPSSFLNHSAPNDGECNSLRPSIDRRLVRNHQPQVKISAAERAAADQHILPTKINESDPKSVVVAPSVPHLKRPVTQTKDSAVAEYVGSASVKSSTGGWFLSAMIPGVSYRVVECLVGTVRDVRIVTASDDLRTREWLRNGNLFRTRKRPVGRDGSFFPSSECDLSVCTAQLIDEPGLHVYKEVHTVLPDFM